MEPTKIGLTQNIEAALSYVFGFISGIILFIIERKNKFISFHALQSFIFFLGLSIISAVVGWIPLIGGILSSVIGIFSFASWIYLIYQAYKGNMFKIPMIGDVVWNQINK